MRDFASPERSPPPLDPVGGLAERGEWLAKRWLVALLETRPLAAAAGVPAGELAKHGPALCTAVVRALVSDAELARLRDGGDLAELAGRAGRLAGAEHGPAAVEAIELLRRVIGRALEDAAGGAGETAGAPAEELLRLGDRLAHVCAAVTAATLMAGRAGAPAAERRAAPVEGSSSAAELSEVSAARGVDAPLWLDALEQELAGGRRFALLLVELENADRLRAAGPPGVVDDAFDRAGRTVRERLRRADLVAHEEPGRYWVIAPDAGRAAANSLADRLAASVGRGEDLAGTPLKASVGIAVHPEDGRTVAELTGHAEEEAFAARAEGRPRAVPES